MNKTTTRQLIVRKWKSIHSYLGWEDSIAVSLIFLGVLGYVDGVVHLISYLSTFYQDIRSELIGIGITVLIIDNVNEMVRRRAEKERLILQMGSPEHGFAIEAARQLHTRGWLDALKSANLVKANLSDSRLSGANLNHSNLIGANLSGGIFIGANLSEANLYQASLQKADLRGADLSRANLRQADLREAFLIGKDRRKDNAPRVDNHAEGSATFLQNAVLIDSDLSYADLTDADVSTEQLASACDLTGAIMPDGKVFNPVIHTEVANVSHFIG